MSLRVPARQPSWALSPLVVGSEVPVSLGAVWFMTLRRLKALCWVQRLNGEPQLVPGLIDLALQALEHGIDSPPRAHSGESDMPGTAHS